MDSERLCTGFVESSCRRPPRVVAAATVARMNESDALIGAEDRVALLREGIVVDDAGTEDGRLRVDVTGGGEDRVERVVRDLLGDETDVRVLAVLPRRLVPRPCVGHMEREEGRLQVRLVLWLDEHVDDIVVAEDA